MTPPTVSVIVPVYNGAAFLAEALTALEAQDYPAVEIIVVDDGSTDGTAEVVQQFPAVRYQRQANAGPSAARNSGIAHCSGELVTFCDCDDLFRPTKVRVQADHLTSHPEVGCVLVHHQTFFDARVERPDWLKDDEGVQPQSAMVRRSVLREVGGFDPAYRLTEGMEWLGRLRSAGVRIDVLDDVVVDRRIHGRNLSYQREGLQHNLLQSLRDRIKQSQGAPRS